MAFISEANNPEPAILMTVDIDNAARTPLL